jgi:phospholipid/cholesterol/gamma-HCH transport system substrate-binding protein
MRNTLETRLGIFFAVALIAAIILVEMIGGFNFFRPGMRVHAHFDRVLELREGDPVKLAGVDVGRVESLGFADNQVRVTIKLDRREDMIKTDSTASIRFVGLMGQNYVAIGFGSEQAPAVSEGAVLQTVEQPDMATLMARLDSVAAGFDDFTRTFTPDTLQNLVGPFSDFLRENAPRLTEIVGNVQSVTGQMAAGEGTMGKLLTDDELYQSTLGAVNNLNTTADELRQTIGVARLSLDSFSEGRGTLGRLATDEGLYLETATAMENLREILQKINKGDGTVGKIVNDEALYRNARMTLQKVDRATEGLEDQGPLSVLGIIANGLF